MEKYSNMLYPTINCDGCNNEIRSNDGGQGSLGKQQYCGSCFDVAYDFFLKQTEIDDETFNQLNEVMKNINIVTDEAVFLTTTPSKKGFFYKLWHDEPKAISFISPCITPTRIRPDATFVCDVFKDGNYWHMWMNQEQIDEARSTGFSVVIDAKDPQMYEGWQGMHLANLDSKGYD